jgi:DNA polymerase
MLIEQLALADLHAISANTDGATVIVPKDKLSVYNEVCKNWENRTRYGLEYTYYKLYARRDVNNYIAITGDGYVKTKGIFTKDAPLRFSNMTDPLSKGVDGPIVSIALYEYFVNNKPIEETVRNHTDIYDFCISKKIDDKFTNEFHYIKDGDLVIDTLQKSVRYYVSKTGGSLFKVDKATNAYSNYEASKTVTMFNDYIEHDTMVQYNIDYAYYINRIQKVVNEIINPQLSLWDSQYYA